MSVTAKLTPIGNSKGIRIPKLLLVKYDLQDDIIIEETERGLLIHAKDQKKLSWEDTYKAMQTEQEEWSDWHGFEDDQEI